jgi:hypothetical protein
VRTEQLSDLLSLRRTVDQLAAGLGVSGDELQRDFTVRLFREAAEGLGLDAEPEVAKLGRAGRLFRQDLSLQLLELQRLYAAEAARESVH